MPKTIDFSKPEWHEYEDLVCDALRNENPDLIIERNIKVMGRNSGKKRQIDIAIRSQLVGHNIFSVVDCKYYSRKLDVNDIGSFKSFIEDVGADIGILITQMGYSKSAETLAKNSRVKLDIRTLEELRDYKISIDFCDECDPGEEHLPGVIQWSGYYDGLSVDSDNQVLVGYCDWCNTLHIRCLGCDSITPILELTSDKKIECLGGCGTSFLLTSRYIGHGMLEYELHVLDE